MGAQPEPWRTLSAEIRKLREQVRRLGNASAFTGTGVHPNGDQGLDSDNFVPGTSGFSLHGGTGNAEFNDLTLRGGIIGNEALTSPVVPGVANLTVSNFGLGSGSYTEVAGQDITVPDGCTRLLFNGTGIVDVYNPKTAGGNNGTGGDWLYCRVKVGAVDSGHTQAVGVSGSGGNATVTDTFAQSLSGLTPGSAVRASVLSVSDYGIAVDAGNLAMLSATLIWLR